MYFATLPEQESDDGACEEEDRYADRKADGETHMR